MIHWLIDGSLRNRFLVIAGFLLLGGWGYWALRTVPIDAIVSPLVGTITGAWQEYEWMPP